MHIPMWRIHCSGAHLDAPRSPEISRQKITGPAHGLSIQENMAKGLWDHRSGPWDFSVKTFFAGEPSPFPGLVWNFGWTENSPSSRIASRDVRLMRTEAPGLRGGSAQPAPGPAVPQPENAAEMGSCGPGIKAQASLHPDFFFFTSYYFISSFSSITDKLIINMFECLLCSRHSSKDFTCELVHLNLTITLQVPYQFHFLANETEK